MLPPPASPPTPGCIPPTFSGRRLGARARVDSTLPPRPTVRPRQPARAAPPRTRRGPGPGGGTRSCARRSPRPGSQAQGDWVSRPGGRERERGGRIPPAPPSPARAQASHVVVASRGRRGGSGPEETGSRALGARTAGTGVLSPPPPTGQSRTAVRAGRGARPGPPPGAESGPGGGRKRPPPPPWPQRAAPARPAGPRCLARAGGSYLLPGAAARGPGPGGGGGGGCGWAGSLRGAGRRQ